MYSVRTLRIFSVSTLYIHGCTIFHVVDTPLTFCVQYCCLYTMHCRNYRYFCTVYLVSVPHNFPILNMSH